MRQKHRPQRTCLGCGQRDDKELMLRLILQESGDLEVNRVGRGRGGYLHVQEGCWEAFVKRKNVFRAFHSYVGREMRERLVRLLRCENREKR